MKKTRRNLPKRVYIKHGAYWHVAQNKWRRLCAVKDGLPMMYRALAEIEEASIGDDMMPKLISKWLAEVSSSRSTKTQANDQYQCRLISDEFEEFRAIDVKPSHVMEFLKQFKNRPRSYNAYRAMLRELMRYAEQHDFRPPGSNPCESVKTMTVKARTRYITDSELRRIKVAACYGDDGKRTQSGRLICSLIDMAYLTGQRIGDLLTLQWSDISTDGIHFDPSKLSGSTAAKVLIGWTPRLRELVRRLKELKLSRPGSSDWIFVTRNGTPYRYTGASTAWKRALKRSGVTGCTFHDLRAKAITDKDEKEGIGAARRMGAHSTEAQTADYIRHRKAIPTSATR